MFLLLFTILLFSLIAWKGLKFVNYIDNVMGIMEKIPGPTPYPFVGNLFQFGLKPEEYPKKILQYCRKYNFQGFRSMVFFQYHVMLSDPAEIQNILSSSSLLYKEHLYSFLRPWLGDGLVTAAGARWLKHRQIYAPAFEQNAVNGYLQVVHQAGKRLVAKLAERAAADGVAKVLDVQPLLGKCTLDIAVENATGIPSFELNDGRTELHAAIIDLCDVIKERTFSIVKRFDTLFQLTPHYWKQRIALSTLERIINKIVDQRRQSLQQSAQQPPMQQQQQEQKLLTRTTVRPFLDVLLNAQLDRRTLTNREIFEELSTFIFTEHNCTTSALSFTLYILSRHNDIQAKLYAEQQGIFGTDSAEQLANVSSVECVHLEQMRYLEFVIRETLRLYPSVPLIARTNRKAIDIDGMKIAKRTTVIMCLIAMGYNEKYFNEPTVFRPERWEHINVNESMGLQAFTSVPFSAGPRRCIAEKYAMYELKALLSMIVRNLEILPAKDGLPSGINDHSRMDCVPQSEYDPILNIRVTLKSENGIQLRLKRRINATKQKSRVVTK
ncbi:probable cytochrome P450 4ad1 isoform X1 [Ceratitis capitata]|uniref:Putative cytochrome P450 4ad1 n=1 Tax=Ceratitis capitata TaxID=7213 RepID=W8C251_CERCA|nr:probable cytochrome P450 4ad1 isoform X1 [Ceratitis capitata]